MTAIKEWKLPYDNKTESITSQLQDLLKVPIETPISQHVVKQVKNIIQRHKTKQAKNEEAEIFINDYKILLKENEELKEDKKRVLSVLE